MTHPSVTDSRVLAEFAEKDRPGKPATVLPHQRSVEARVSCFRKSRTARSNLSFEDSSLFRHMASILETKRRNDK